MSVGNYAFGGIQRSYSFPFFHADRIPVSLVAARCPNMPCEQVWIQNSSASAGDIIVGDYDTVAGTGNGIRLRPGDTMGWIPIQNLSLISYKCLVAASWLNYAIVR